MRVVRIELGSTIVTGNGAGDPSNTTRVTVTCDGGRVRLRVDDPITGKALERSIEIADVAPAVRARILGLAIVELVAASWIELELRPAQPRGDANQGSAGRGAQRAAIAVARRRKRVDRLEPNVVIDASVSERRHENVLSMRAAEVRGSYRLGRLSIGIDGQFGVGSRPLESGSVEVYLWTVGAHTAAQVEFDRLQLQAGVGGSAGAARLRGHSKIGAGEMAFSAPVATLRGIVTARARATDRWSLHISVEAGVILAGVDAIAPVNIERVYRGKFAGLASGVGVAF